jgi:hypothetical protein
LAARGAAIAGGSTTGYCDTAEWVWLRSANPMRYADNLSGSHNTVYNNSCDRAGVVWIIALAFLGFCGWRVARARERAAELAAAGISHSPLYWLANALVGLLLALVLYIAHIHNEEPVPSLLWFAVFAIIMALLVLRRALRWRYPL